MELNKCIIILTPGFPKDEADTTCVPYIQDFVFAFLKAYPHITLKIVSIHYPFQKGHYKWNGIDVYSAGGRNSKALRLLTWIKVWTQLRKINKTYNLITIQSFWLSQAAFIGQLFSRVHKTPHVMATLGQDAKRDNSYLKILSLRRDPLIAISQALIDELSESTGFRTKILIPFGINIDILPEIANNKREIGVIGVGSLTALKNYTLFIEVIEELRKSIPDIKACIVGDGPQRSLLTKMIADKGLQKNITLMGSLSHIEAMRMMGQSKVLLHTSTYEGQSMVMLEGLAEGLTIISFNLGKIHEEKRKIVCNNKTEMVEALRKLFTDNQFDHTPLILQTMDNTLKEFGKLYGLNQ